MKPRHPRVEELMRAAEAWAGRWFRANADYSLLVLAGPPGTGKTHVATALHTYARGAAFYSFESGGWGASEVPKVEWLSWPETVDGFKDGHYLVVDDAMTVSALFVDDIGAEHDPSANGQNKLCQILTRRERMHTVVTTNIGPGDWENRFDPRIADRLLRNSVVVDLSGVPSYQHG